LIAGILLITVLAFVDGIFPTIAAIYTIIPSCPAILLLFNCWPEIVHRLHLLTPALPELIALALPELHFLTLVTLPGSAVLDLTPPGMHAIPARHLIQILTLSRKLMGDFTAHKQAVI
jgi:hypothetical protein